MMLEFLNEYLVGDMDWRLQTSDREIGYGPNGQDYRRIRRRKKEKELQI